MPSRQILVGGETELVDFQAERDRMVRNLIEEGLLRTQSVIEAMRKVPRELFVSGSMGQYAHADTPLPTEHGQTISAPHSQLSWALHGRHDG